MPRCIFCDQQTEADIAQGRSVCLDCLAGWKRLELKHADELTRRLFPKEFCEALNRLNKMDLDEPTKEDMVNLKPDIQTIKKYSPKP